MFLLQATTHQGDPQLYSGNGKQCVCNSLVAVMEATRKPPCQWPYSTLEKILLKGDMMYIDMKENINHEYLQISDIPTVVKDKMIIKSEEFFGTLKQSANDMPGIELEDAVNNIQKNFDGMILLIGNKSPTYASAIIKNNESFFFFDPHSRNDSGMCAADGKATLTKHKSLADLCLFTRHLCASIFKNVNIQFEIRGINVIDISGLEESDSFESSSESDFSGFDYVSEAELVEAHLRVKALSDNLSNVDDTETFINDIMINLNDSEVLMKEIDMEILNEFDSTRNGQDTGTDITGHEHCIGTDITGHEPDIGTDITRQEQDIGTDITRHEHGIGTDITGHEPDIGTDITGHDQDIGTDITRHEQDIGTDISIHEHGIGTDITGHEQDIGTDISGQEHGIETDITGHRDRHLRT
ncbi:uncharacterized protein LOC127838063 isoform X2 [Dreissena polymorpha]|nr:uncharacterized protein LOC127838063 isoform X2 [Dreissena polymorpha]